MPGSPDSTAESAEQLVDSRRGKLHPAVARVREAVRAALRELPADTTVLVACSGGADSLALAAAIAFEAPKLRLRAGAVIVDHGLQADSAHAAAIAADQCRSLGLDPVEVRAVEVGSEGGPEGAARAARYDALRAAADQFGADVVLLAHTRDDQAETVLLGLARGSGARSLAGMAPVAGLLRRPLLEVPRASTAAACIASGLRPWHDPHNDDPQYRRVRVRHEVLPVLEEALGPGVTEALARTAGLLRADADALDALAADLAETAVRRTDDEVLCDIGMLEAEPEAIRTRALRQAALEAGCHATDLTAGHVAAIDAFVTGWRGQRWIDLPQGVRAMRRGGFIHLKPRVTG
ncbi:tRNA(Ile)-lysidine synthetase [Kribbella flavida DSM 17836]|uniref:tRNA(Ile)-lysidine synthase n=1 Tax=Kribbella flavida (strain DSM 17836 / JCM 10339 / NBRC 14399) TaxID=479435 RepID=D2PY99_KRIFD|nr:tRNA lysidine(34) synthetase TilS [Kribbella flavida]ADB35467.1 tRNA(Ile)-lysidine synthetase [Kribbella flavida DSM 17836]